MAVPKDYRYTDSHEWVRIEEDNLVTVGITDYAQEKLGDIVSVELPRLGDEVERGERIGMIDSQKASSEVFAPVSGVIAEVNELLNDDPAVINSDPHEEGWIVRIEVEEIEQIDDLMSADDYEELIGRLDEEDAD
ncbi:MAG: glycine cleavage system protein GcvH [Deltaproteobacteria bacterium]|jgi:glycine cleavage system H protein|nr:glycine cleavage system protein GcvH [Deltaproteobacteria bacterium]